MSAPRGLSPHEAELWDKLSSTVEPLRSNPPQAGNANRVMQGGEAPSPKHRSFVSASKQAAPLQRPADRPVAAPTPAKNAGLDSHWERRLSRTSTDPDFTLDLHGHTLDQAYRRLDAGLIQAKAMGARLVLVVTGKSRPVDAADRGERRGAIRAKILDWLAAGQHSTDIAAIRKAHRRHGGEGAIYLVLKRRR